MSKLQSYLNKVKKNFVFEVQLDTPISPGVLEKKLADLGISTLVEKPNGQPGQYQMVLSYPVTGQELLTRICENNNHLVTVHDETGQVYSNKPLPKEEPAQIVKEQAMSEPVPVVEIKKTVAPAPALKEALDTGKIVKGITESLTVNLQSLRQELQEEKAAATRYQQFSELKTSASISAINENVANLQAVLIQMSNEITKLNSVVAEALGNYNSKLVELAESNNKLNHRVVKNVKRDDRGYITEVTEQIITEK